MIFLEADRIVFFGDSLTDAGAVFDLASQILVSPTILESAGYAGVLSNGPVYSQTLPGLLGLDSIVYAIGGARAIGERPFYKALGLNGPDPSLEPDNPVSGLFQSGLDTEFVQTVLLYDTNLDAQVARFVVNEANSLYEGTTIASFLIGLNDFGSIDPDSPDLLNEAIILVQGVLSQTFAAAQSTIELGGVDGLIFYSYPTGEFLPSAAELDPETLTSLNSLIEYHTLVLKLFASKFSADGIPSTVIELGQITREIDADMGTFGFLEKGPVLLGDATDPQILPPNSPDDLPTFVFPENPEVADVPVDKILFYDFLHPTTALHDVLAVFSQASLTKETHFLDDLANFHVATTAGDFALSKGGDDLLVLGEGDDIGLGGLGDDIVSGSWGADIVSGGSGNDSLYGGFGEDLLSGGSEDDLINGGDGNDFIIDGLGSDIVFAGSGSDVLLWKEGESPNALTGSQDMFAGGIGEDTLYLILTEQTKVGLASDMVERTPWEIEAGAWNLASIGIKAIGIEDVVIIDGLDEIANVSSTTLQQVDLWGFA